MFGVAGHRRQRMRHHMHRQVGRGGDGVAGEAARHPDFVHESKARLPAVRQARQLPGPVADDAAAGDAGVAERPHRMRQIGAVDVDDQAAARRAKRAAMRRTRQIALRRRRR